MSLESEENRPVAARPQISLPVKDKPNIAPGGSKAAALLQRVRRQPELDNTSARVVLAFLHRRRFSERTAVYEIRAQASIGYGGRAGGGGDSLVDDSCASLQSGAGLLNAPSGAPAAI